MQKGDLRELLAMDLHTVGCLAIDRKVPKPIILNGVWGSFLDEGIGECDAPVNERRDDFRPDVLFCKHPIGRIGTMKGSSAFVPHLDGRHHSSLG